MVFITGNVDIWNNDKGRKPVCTMKCPGEVQRLALKHDSLCVSASHENLLSVCLQQDGQIQQYDVQEMDQKVGICGGKNFKLKMV